MSKCIGDGRFGNQIIRAIASSMFAEKFNLLIKYQNHKNIEKIGIKLFVGNKKYEKNKKLKDSNYFEYFNRKNIDFNIKTSSFLQTKEISDHMHKYLMSDKITKKIISDNKYQSRYNNNNDCFVHIRLGDVAHYNPGFEYYDKIISNLKFDNLFVSTDDLNHDIIIKLKNKYEKLQMHVSNDLPDIIKFASTCKYIILSYGTFSTIIGYLAFYSYVYSLKYCKEYAWDYGKSNMITDKYTKLGKWIQN